MINTVIIDDNKKSIDLLNILLSKTCPKINVIGEASNYKDAIDLIRKTSPDLIFLDIDLLTDHVNGFNVIDNFKNADFKIIVVSGHDYALKAFEYDVVDYLIKPVEVQKLVKAVNKVEINLKKNVCKGFVSIPSITKVELIDVKDIIYFYAEGKYTLIKLKTNKEILSSRNLKEFEDKLDVNIFFRIHKSYLININNLNFIDKKKCFSCVMINGDRVPVSRRKKESFSNYIGLK